MLLVLKELPPTCTTTCLALTQYIVQDVFVKI